MREPCGYDQMTGELVAKHDLVKNWNGIWTHRRNRDPKPAELTPYKPKAREGQHDPELPVSQPWKVDVESWELKPPVEVI